MVTVVEMVIAAVTEIVVAMTAPRRSRDDRRGERRDDRRRDDRRSDRPRGDRKPRHQGEGFKPYFKD